MLRRALPLILLLGARTAHADLNLMLAETPRAMSLAGAYTAIADDAAALYYNPAGLSRLDGSYVGLAVVLGFPFLSARAGGAETPIATPRDDGYGVHLAWSPRDFAGGDLGLGFSVLLPHRRALRFSVHRFEDPYFVLFENSVEVLHVRAGVAYRFFDVVSVGASALLLAGLDGTVELSSPFQSRDMVDESMRTSVAVNALLPNRTFYTAGVQVYPLPGLTLGLSYREASFVPIKLPIDLSLKLFGLPSVIRTVADLDVKVKYAPAQLNLGAAYQLDEAWLVSFELGFAEFSRYEVPYGNVTLDSRFSPDVVLLPPRAPKLSLRNLWVPRLGVEWRASPELTLRGGYSFARSFLRAADAPILDSDRHNLTAGLSFALGRYFLPDTSQLDLIAAGQLVLFASRQTAGQDHGGQVVSTTFGAEFRY